MTKQECIERLELICNKSKEVRNPAYDLDTSVKEWEGYGKSRAYFKIVETCKGTKHYATYDYGYFDNQSCEYVEGRHDLRQNWYVTGNGKFEE